MSIRRLGSVGVAVFAACLVAGVTGSCAPIPDPTRYTIIATPKESEFSGDLGATVPVFGLEQVIERRCGTLDCHGQVGRPFRIYSQNGLREPTDADNEPGGAPTTASEIQDNFEAAVGLQPELMSAVVTDPTNNPPDTLLLVRKPRQEERHKGGQVVVAGDDADTCMTSWLEGQIDTAACKAAAAVP
jgi:hypothetical protein